MRRERLMRFLGEGVLVVVTLGLYVPWWIGVRSDELRRASSQSRRAVLPWILAGAAIAAFARVMFGELTGTEEVAVLLSMLGIGAVLVGVHAFMENVDAACRTVGVAPPVAPIAMTLFLAGAWIGTELGNAFPTPAIRLPVLALVFLQPLLFWRVFDALEDVRERVPPLQPPAVPAAIS